MEQISRELSLARPRAVSIIAVAGDAALEATALRGVLEQLNYRVEIHWVGSRRQLTDILSGRSATCEHLIICARGKNGAILLPEHAPITAQELKGLIHLPGKTVLSTGCTTGDLQLADEFLQGGCASFIGPIDSVDRKSALMFAIHLLYYLAMGSTLDEAVERSREHDADCGLFRVFYL